MTLDSGQEALIACIPAPDPGTGINRWDSQIGYYGGIYYNQSSGPVTMESVSLLHPHNLILHGADVYKMAHYKISLPFEWAWGHEGTARSATQWAAIRQRIPGATIPPENGPIAPADFTRLRPRRLRDSRGHVRGLTRRRLGAGRGGDIPRRRHDLHVNPDGRTCHRLGSQTPVLDLRRADTLRPGLLEGTLTEPSSCTHASLSQLRRGGILGCQRAPVLRALARAPGPCGNCPLAAARGWHNLTPSTVWKI